MAASDQEEANDVRTKAQALRDSIVAARNAGLTVEIPAMLVHWLDQGTAPGELSHWKFTRGSF